MPKTQKIAETIKIGGKKAHYYKFGSKADCKRYGKNQKESNHKNQYRVKGYNRHGSKVYAVYVRWAKQK